jgi:antitoxin component of RelBE/YafQ-DinJ toxin-antitoxin module
LARVNSVQIKMEPEVQRQFSALAKEFGITVSSLAAQVLGEYVYKHNQIIKPAVAEITEVIKHTALKELESKLNKGQK